MTLAALVTYVGSKPVGSDLRKATLSLYWDGTYQTDVEVMLEDPKVGDKHDVKIEKKS